MIGDARMLFPVPLVHIIDNEALANMLNGYAMAPSVLEHKLVVKSLRWNLHVLEHCWMFRPMSGTRGLVQHVTRDFNRAADAWANYALSHGEYSDLSPFPLASADCAVVLSTDGACPGNPGLGAAAACVHVLFQGVMFPVAVQCLRLGRTTSFQAELEAASLGIRLLVDWCLFNGTCRSG
jgi:hypothetical protein